ncbi:hypothetical protein, partial [Sphingorhabdus sp.]|uniref:hypothetical protein n=1 Tax=Sphingorhabdus sp. TaxID=1902408 RepID=UPI003C71821E
MIKCLFDAAFAICGKGECLALPAPSPYRPATMSAPPILAYENLSLQQGAGWLFTDINMFIGPRDRLALIGRNGAGK